MEKLKPEDILSIEELNPEDILSVEEPEMPKSTLETIGESVGDVARGIGSGLLMGGLEEATAGYKALTSPEKDDFSTLYRKYLEIEEKKATEAKERSPFLTGVGEFTGSILPGFVTGGATLAASGGRAVAQLGAKELAKAAGKAALVGAGTGAAGGAVSGALSSEEGKLIGATEEEKQKLLEDIGSGAKFGGLFGGAIGAASPLVGKTASWAKDKLDETILGKQAKYIKEASEEGKGFITEPEVRERVVEISSDVDDLRAQFKAIEDSAAMEFKQPLEVAKDFGDSIYLSLDIDPETGSSKILDFFLASGKKNLAKKIYDASTNGLDAVSAYGLRKELKEASAADPKLRDYVDDLAGELNRKIEDVVQSDRVQLYLKENNLPTSYIGGLETYSKLLKATIESITEKGNPIDARRRYFHDLPAEDATLLQNINDLISTLTLPGTTSHSAIKTIESKKGGIRPLLEKLSKEKPEEMDRVAKRVGYENLEDLKNQLINKIEKTSIKSTSLRAFGGERPIDSGVEIPKPSLGRKGILHSAAYYGKAKEIISPFVKSKPVQMSKAIYNMPENQLLKISEQLSSSPKFKQYADNLKKALEAGDTIKKNAMLFAIAQNPEAREAIGSMVGITEEE